MQLTFVVDDALGTGQRKRSPRACDGCKAKKKRCTHSSALQTTSSKHEGQIGAAGTRSLRNQDRLSGASTTAESDNESSNCAVTPLEGSQPCEPDSSQVPDGQLSGGGSPARSQRFIGDLNPETVFYSETNAAIDIDSSKQNDVGLWVSGLKGTQQDTTVEQHSNRPDSSAQGRKRALDSDDHSLPLPETQSVLIDVYFSKIQPLLPLLDEKTFKQTICDKSASPILVKAVCLVACKDSSAATNLRFQAESSTIPAREFGRRIYADLSSGRIEEEERNMVTAIRCLALMSLHSEGPDGGERSSWDLMRAIHLAQTIGLHLGHGQKIQRSSESLLSLFWALWSLDRINAAINGRPVMLHDRDIGLRIKDSCQLFDAPFRVWLRLAQDLDKVIELYRPAATVSTSGSENNFLGFEDLVDQCDGWDIGQNILVSLEIVHHAVWILSCRLRTVNEHPLSKISYLRQCSSAQQIASIMQLHSHTYLAPLPIIPYAISLSLAVAYKQLRRSKLATTKEVTKKQLVTCSQALEELSATWWSAGTMAKLAKQALLQLENAPGIVSSRVNRNNGNKPVLRSPVPSPIQNRTTSASSNAGLVGPAGMENNRGLPSQPLSGDGCQLADFNHTRPNGEAYPDTIHRGSAFDPSSLNAVSSEPNFWADSTDIDDIDVFLGNFLDLRSCANVAQDMEFMNSLTDIG